MNKLLFYMLACCLTLCIKAQSYDNYKYLLNDNSVVIDGGGLPIVFINTHDRMILKDSYILASMKIINNPAGELNYSDTIKHQNQMVDYEGYVAIKYRGHTSFTESYKKPYAIVTLKSDTLPDEGGKKDRVKILGMGKDNKWVMLAPWCDRSMIRDVLAFELGRPWFDFTPHTRLCEVILDGTYTGVYVFAEKNSQGKKRLDLHDPGEDGDDTTGDYLLKVDRTDSETPYYTSSYHPWGSMSGKTLWSSVKYQYVFPDEDDFEDNPQLKKNINSEIAKMEKTFNSKSYTDSVTGYRSQVDVNSFINYMLSTEFAMNIDGYRLSTYIYKYSETHAKTDSLDARWKMGLWDFNIAYGNANYYHGDETNVWQYEFNLREPSESEHVPFYWYKMLNDTWYIQQLKLRWAAYRAGNYSDEALVATVDSLSNLLVNSGAVERNQKAWSIIGRAGVWPCPYTATSYNKEILHLKDWMAKRAAFMDEQLTPDEPPTGILAADRPKQPAVKFLRDGRIIIARNGHHYNVAGQLEK